MFDGVPIDAQTQTTLSLGHEGSDDPELMEFTKGNAHGTNALVFGRVTYEVMVVWWPTPAAAKAMPEIAKGTNEVGGTIWLIPQLTS